MAELNVNPGSCTSAQRKRLAIVAVRRRISIDDLRGMVGCRLHDLSAADASEWITRLSGRGLPNPPGQKPSPYQGRKATATRMITDDHCEQIVRLLEAYFGNLTAGLAWLAKHHKVPAPRELLTAQRAGEVIAVLKNMTVRREVVHEHR